MFVDTWYPDCVVRIEGRHCRILSYPAFHTQCIETVRMNTQYSLLYSFLRRVILHWRYVFSKVWTFFSHNFSIFHMFLSFFQIFVKFYELLLLLPENFTNSDRTPPYIYTYL